MASGVLLGAMFAGLDAGLGGIGEVRLRALRDAGGADGRTADRILEKLPKIQARFLAGRVLCISFAAGLGFHYAFTHLQVHMSVAFISVATVAFVYGLLAEIATTLMRRRAGRFTVRVLRFLRPLEIMMVPLAAPLAWVGILVERMIPRHSEPEGEKIATLEVQHVIDDGEESGSISEEHADMLRSVLEFKDTIAREVMVPRTQMKAIEISLPIRQVLAFVSEEGHSRYPIYRERMDRIEGVLYAKDLFKVVQQNRIDEAKLADLMRKPPYFVAVSQKIGTLLREMKLRRVHLAIVSDEFGGTAGIVTLEDILEEIVGEIHDEHDEGDPAIKQVAPDRWVAQAGVALSDLEAFLEARVRPDGETETQTEYDTLGGLMLALAGRVPEAGEKMEVPGWVLIVRDADERRVQRVEIVRKSPEPRDAAA